MKPSEYQEKIQKYMTHEELLPLWEDIIEKRTNEWAGGMALQYLIVRAFEIEKAEVTYAFQVKMIEAYATSKKPFEEIDGVVYIKTEGLSVLIESKDKVSNVNIDPITKMGNQLSRRPASTIGAVFSSTGFTDGVLDQMMLPHTHKTLLWDIDDIDYCLKNKCFIKGMVAKYRYAVEQGFYHGNLKAIWDIQ